MKLRSFISIELSDALKACLEEIQGELRKHKADIRWVNTKNIHLTLKFLGTINEADAEVITEAIRSACSTYQPFHLNVSGFGVFPGSRSPRVLWVGMEQSEMLSGLQDEIDRRLTSLGFEREKSKFHPHLTLGRFRSSRGKEALINSIPLLEGGRIGTVHVTSVNLMRSDLHPGGARYSVISKVMLGHDRP